MFLIICGGFLEGKEFRLLWWLRNSLETFIEAGIKTVSSSPLSAALEHSVFTRRLQLGTPCVRAPGLKESGILKCQTAHRSLLLKYEGGHMKTACSHHVCLVVISMCKLNIFETATAFVLNLSLKEIPFCAKYWLLIPMMLWDFLYLHFAEFHRGAAPFSPSPHTLKKKKF